MSTTKPTLMTLPVEQIHVRKNVRTSFDPDKLKELSLSVGALGVQQPLIVRVQQDRHELVAGERRLRASKMAGLAEVPCVVHRHMSDALAFEIQLVENLGREDMGVLDEAFAVKRLYETLGERGATTKAVGERLGKSDFYVVSLLRITELPPRALEAVRKGVFNKGVAYEIAKLKTRQLQLDATTELIPTKKGAKPPTLSQAKRVIRQLLAAMPEKGKEIKRDPSAAKNYMKDWHYWLLQMTGPEFFEFRRICNGRWNAGVMAEAVDVVMRKRDGASVLSDLPRNNNGAREARAS